MQIAQAMRLAAEHSCELYRDTDSGDWVVASISYDSDACSLSDAKLLEIDAKAFLADYIPDRF
ncbi:hypothetical protein [Polycyclovorans algicola]|uniref:hypothetical protein n=1 Tax=Polycyclovorans algicola TaxID=616992 RepID=UPI0004A73E74|nr:hypothetical protein [Polycyclovorans algicola]